MKVKALKSFVGKVCMKPGDIREVSDALGLDLQKAGYVEVVEEKPKRRNTKKK